MPESCAADLRAPWPLRGNTSARRCDLVLPPRPQRDGYADADGDDDDQSDCEANEKAAHGLNVVQGVRGRAPIPLFSYLLVIINR